MRKHILLIIMALGSATLASGCSVSGPQATMVAKATVQGNAAGAAVAGIVNPAVAVPAAAAAGVGDALACGVSAIFGGGC